MPELPEVESARALIAERGLDREIVDVDDADTYVCRPHAPGELRDALVGHRLTSAHRQGKSMWIETDGGRCSGCTSAWPGGSSSTTRRRATTGPTAAASTCRSGIASRCASPTAAGWRCATSAASAAPSWTRELDRLGPDAAEVTRDDFRARVGRGEAPLKARIMDQSVIAGVGNLLADEALWRAKLDPRRPAGGLDDDELDRLRREIRATTRRAIERGGVHTGDVIPHRRRDGVCPRCGADMARATIGGRTTYWCAAEQGDGAA